MTQPPREELVETSATLTTCWVTSSRLSSTTRKYEFSRNQLFYFGRLSLFLFNLVSFISQRLKIAREFGDKAAERRAYSNLGNSHIFLGEFEKAAEHYK